MTDPRKFAGLMRRTATAASKHQKLFDELAELFEERYGSNWNDAQIDGLIDKFDYNGGDVPSMRELDRIMEDEGFPVLEEKKNDETE